MRFQDKFFKDFALPALLRRFLAARLAFRLAGRGGGFFRACFAARLRRLPTRFRAFAERERKIVGVLLCGTGMQDCHLVSPLVLKFTSSMDSRFPTIMIRLRRRALLRERDRRSACSQVTQVIDPPRNRRPRSRSVTASPSAFYSEIVWAHRPRFPIVRVAALRRSESFPHTNARTHRLRMPKCASRFDRGTNDRA